MKVILIVPVIPSKYVHWVFIHYSWMGVSCCWRGFKFVRSENFLPRIIVDIVLKEVIYSIKAIIPPKDKYWAIVHYRNMSIPWRWRHIICFYFSPLVAINVVAVEVIFSCHPIIAPKYVNLIFKAYTWM